MDGDIIAYRCAASCEPTKNKPQLESRDDAINRLENLMQDVVHDTLADKYRCFLGGSNNFRKKIAETYKATRTTPPPTYLADCKQYLVEHWSAELADNCEADDLLGIAQTNANNWVAEQRKTKPVLENTIICSIDKDLLQIPGWHYNFVKLEQQRVTEHQGWVNFFTQMILGDKSDNVMGYDGKARPVPPQFLIPKLTDLKHLEPEDMFVHVWDMYDDKEQFKTNYKLLWIWRQPDDQHDFLKQQLERVQQ